LGRKRGKTTKSVKGKALKLCNLCLQVDCICVLYEDSDSEISLAAHLFSSDDDDDDDSYERSALNTGDFVQGFDPDLSNRLATVDDYQVQIDVLSSSDSDSSSVYEEPEENADSEEGLMEEVVRGQLMNGWEDDEDEEEEEEEEEDLEILLNGPLSEAEELIEQDLEDDRNSQADDEALLDEETKAIQEEMEMPDRMDLDETSFLGPRFEDFDTMNVMMEDAVAPPGPIPRTFEIKKTQIGPNGEILTTTKSIKWQSHKGVGESSDGKKKKNAERNEHNYSKSLSNQIPIHSNISSLYNQAPMVPPWLALAAMKMNPATYASLKPPLAPNTSHSQLSSLLPLHVVPFAAKFLVRPVNASSVSHAAAALMASPAAMKAFTDLKDLESEALVSIIELHSKIKAAAQASVASASSAKTEAEKKV
jgi:hypothetical protein